MIFYLPITKERLKEANREIAKMHRKGENVQIEWLAETG